MAKTSVEIRTKIFNDLNTLKTYDANIILRNSKVRAVISVKPYEKESMISTGL
jgi:hypothetical protein